MNVIRKIRLKNFESHEDTILDGLSPGLNAIVGSSNAGKSSIVRALKLVCYNDFDPRSIRKGAEDCQVEVTTDNGTVKVIRGKRNIWEVTDRTGKTSVFDRIGKQLLPQVTEVLGFGLVKLGDMEMQANIMDQLEAHFMLAEFSGQDATGSLRAQVVDEISGLSGIETLIRDVSLDNSRVTRFINQLEDRNREIAGQLHDVNGLRREEVVVQRAEKLIKLHDENREHAAVLGELLADHAQELDAVDAIDQEVEAFPDESKAQMFLSSADTFVADMTSMVAMQKETDTTLFHLMNIGGELKGLPDAAAAQVLLGRAAKLAEAATGARVLFDGWEHERDLVVDMNKRLIELPDEVLIGLATTSAENLLDELEELTDMLKACREAEDTVRFVNIDYANLCGEEKEAAEQYNELLAGFDVCPVTMKPMSGDCLKGVRLPVLEDKDMR